jgi:hypothetical protein
MYKSSYDIEARDEVNFFKKNLIWLIGLILVVSVIGWLMHSSSQVVDTAFINYHDFQEIWNTTQKINSDMGAIKATPDSDKMFEAFSKNAMLNAKRQQLTRWLEEYNAKSKMWDKALWKSSALPYQLSTNDFSNY